MKTKIKNNIPISIIMAISAFLYSFRITDLGFANKYYAAGVYSMGQNLHAFFFNSLDSVGFVTIDKPPLGFWIQTLFTKVFGFTGWALILPEILCSLASVYLIYHILSTRFGRGAGLAGASILALTPIFCAVTRNNTIDAILILLMVLAAQQAIIATEKASMRHLIFAGIFIGLGFNVKMLQAYMIVPAIYLTYLIFARQKFMKRVLVCAVSVIVMVAISLSWVVAVDMIDPDSRPYVGSSDGNSAVELAIGYNGLNRVFGGGSSITKSIMGQSEQLDSIPDEQVRPDSPNANNIGPYSNPPQDRMGQNQRRPPGQDGNNTQQQMPNQPPDGSMPKQGAGMRQNSGEAGEASLFRLYNDSNAGQISWFIVPALLCCILIAWLIVRRRFAYSSHNIALLLFALCFVPMFVYFCFSSGLAHRYYFATMAPFIAGLVGAGFYFLGKSRKWMIPVVFVLTGLAQLYIHSIYDSWLAGVLTVCTVVFALVTILMIVGVWRKWSNKALLAMMCVLLILPAVWSATPVLYGENAQLPIAGPELMTAKDQFDTTTDYSELISYLEDNRDGATYLVMSASSMDSGAEMIIQSGEAVMVLGGFNGGDSIVDLDEFIQMVDDNVVRYALINNNSNKNNNTQIYNWIKSNCQIVNYDIGSHRSMQRLTLYELN